jgi:hypothetical protein
VTAPFSTAKPKEAAHEPLFEPMRETVEPIAAPLPEAKTEVIEILPPELEVAAPSEPVAPPPPIEPPVMAQEPIAPVATSPVVPPLEIAPVMPEAPATSTPPEVTPQAFVPSPLPSEPVAPPALEPPTSEPPVATPQAFVQAPVPSEPTAPPPVAPAPKVEPQFIAPTPAEPMAPPIPAPVAKPVSGEMITACLKQLLTSRPAARPKLVIIGREGAQVSPMVRHLLGPESSLRKMESAVFQYLEIGERKVEAQPFEIIGISMEKQFSRLLDAAGADLIGCIVVVEAHRKEGLEYLSYLLNMLKTVYRRPLGIAVIKSAEQKNMATETLRDLLNLAPADFVQECPTADRALVNEFLKGFTSEANLQRWAPAEVKG